MPDSNAKIIAILHHNYYLWNRFAVVHTRIDFAVVMILIGIFLIGSLLEKREIISKDNVADLKASSCMLAFIIVCFLTAFQGCITFVTINPIATSDSKGIQICNQKLYTESLTLNKIVRRNTRVVIKNVPKIRPQIKELHHTKKLLNIAKYKEAQSKHHNKLNQWFIYNNAEVRLTKKYRYLHHEVKNNLFILHEFMTGKPSRIII